MRRRAGALALIWLCGALPAAAISGTVVDPGRKPIAGAKVCYLSGDIELLCVNTDAGGYYELVDTELDRIRLSADGFLVRILAAVDHATPIVLERSATLLVRVREAGTGANIDGGEVFVIAVNGRRLGPFPTSKAGVRVRSLQPGNVRVKARVEGYEQSEPVEIELIAGEEVVAEVPVAPAAPAKGEP